MITDWRFNSVDDAFEFLKSREKYGRKPGIKRIRQLLGMLGYPQNTVYTLHIAGTNGKGSVGAYLDNIYRQENMIAFHFSSPAVYDRMDMWKRYGGSLISDQYFLNMASNVCAATQALDHFYVHPTRFEVETAMAFYGSKLFGTDLLILEAGLGGLNDATNVVKWPKACIFTNISYDHMEYLGDTLTEIATEKAGIIKPGCKAFSAEQDPEVKAVLDEKMIYGKVTYVDNSALELISQKPGELKFKYKGEEYVTSLAGLYQMKNAALAIEVAKDFGFLQKSIYEGIKATKWKARFEVLSEEPYFIVDGAHNVDAMTQLAETIKLSFTNQPVNFIIGVLKDKEYQKMMEIIAPLANRIYAITPPNDRGLDAGVLAEEIRKWNKNVVPYASIEEAVTTAMDYAREENQATVALGSLSYLADVKVSHDNYLKK